MRESVRERASERESARERERERAREIESKRELALSTGNIGRGRERRRRERWRDQTLNKNLIWMAGAFKKTNVPSLIPALS